MRRPRCAENACPANRADGRRCRHRCGFSRSAGRSSASTRRDSTACDPIRPAASSPGTRTRNPVVASRWNAPNTARIGHGEKTSAAIPRKCADRGIGHIHSGNPRRGVQPLGVRQTAYEVTVQAGTAAGARKGSTVWWSGQLAGSSRTPAMKEGVVQPRCREPRAGHQLAPGAETVGVGWWASR